MAKRPTPKSRRAKSKGRGQHSVYVKKQVKKLENAVNSPFATKAPSKKLDRVKANPEEITRIKA